ncbi:SsgA family sporulation/cell division regulator [Streptomyces sp. NBC_00038]|uniref:SsgA family sporulation/cell division regulator n=1 Tax=Streptomyces sp. NBC_00038 TaxID=2903615 RepID=UPI00225162CD|nr:SsgA family sporulation/cell division regulator [Streptomyces sp. NBC_00038]MCX5559403.1 SsgA family sporulation/cell division regulator [Streptomyces sp. NBC_00038]
MNITVEQPIGAHLVTSGDRERAVPATLRYTSVDPLAVHIDFPAHVSLDGTEVTWTFARALLAEGLDTPAGIGSVHIWPCGPRRTFVEFRVPQGVAMIWFDTPVLRRFLLRSFTVVEPGGEAVGAVLDQGLTSLFGGV